jgi:nitrate reductase gamma subunit
MVLLGVLLAGFRRIRPNAQPLEGQPRPDRWALVLLGAAVGAGFIVEGVRMAMAGGPSGADYAFLGGALSRLAIGREGLTGLYPWLWYIHAGLWGAFVAYIPFSRMVHIILAPVVLIANAGRKH